MKKIAEDYLDQARKIYESHNGDKKAAPWMRLVNNREFLELLWDREFTQEFLDFFIGRRSRFNPSVWQQVFIPLFNKWEDHWPNGEFEVQFSKLKVESRGTTDPTIIKILVAVAMIVSLLARIQRIQQRLSSRREVITFETTDSAESLLKHLKTKYGQNFIVEENEDGYLVYVEDKPNTEFEARWTGGMGLGRYEDNYQRVLVLEYAAEIGIDYILEEEEGTRLLVPYDHIGALAELLPKIEDLVKKQQEISSLDRLTDTELSMILYPKHEDASQYPSYELDMNRFHIYLLTYDDLSEDIMMHVIEQEYKFNPDLNEDLIPEAYKNTYFEQCEGATVSDEDSTEFYEMVKYGTCLYYADIYRILEDADLVLEKGEHEFIAGTEEYQLKFQLDFRNQNAYITIADMNTGEVLEEYKDYLYASHFMDLFGIKVEAGIGQKASLSQLYEELKDSSLTSGESATLGDWTILLQSVEISKRLEDSSYYFQSEEGETFVRLLLEVTYDGINEYGEEFLGFSGITMNIVSSEGDGFAPVRLISNLSGEYIKNGEPRVGEVVVAIPDKDLGKDLAAIFVQKTEAIFFELNLK